MKRFVLLMLVLFLLIGCGSKSNEDENNNKDNTTVTQENVVTKDTVNQEIAADKEEVKKEEIKKEESKIEKEKVENLKEETPLVEEKKLKVTFIELGSVNCVPCVQMQPVMKAIEEKYGEQVNVVFYDVWQEDQKHYAEKYGIRVIPTQVFLDKNGDEFHRHEGFYPETEIDKILQGKGLTIK